MSNETQHIPADVRERVAREVFALDADWRREYWDHFRRGFPRQAQAYYDTADRILGLLRTPRGEGESARRDETQEEKEDALDLLRWAEARGVALEPVAGNVMPPGTYACYVEGVGDDPAEYEDAGEPYMGPGILGAIRAARRGEEVGSDE